MKNDHRISSRILIENENDFLFKTMTSTELMNAEIIPFEVNLFELTATEYT